MVEIKDRIKEALSIRQMTASELANKSGINKGGISKYINGLIIPKQNAIGAMAQALNVSPAWLMGYDVSMEPSAIITTQDGSHSGIEVRPDFWINYDKLSDKNKEQANSYIEFLLEMQRGKDDDKS